MARGVPWSEIASMYVPTVRIMAARVGSAIARHAAQQSELMTMAITAALDKKGARAQKKAVKELRSL